MKVLSIKEAAEIMPLSKWALYRLAESGESPFRKIAGKWMATEDDIVDWVREGQLPTRAEPMTDPMPSGRMAAVNHWRKVLDGELS